ncbi:unnamed protein product (macronuclear) [Paramecium tetraurelia]|uniref:Uncharacterized protein n=1 Tax=Paramecium tetraurelia TaxID=5888 RepID=A0E8A7_PARTE|nr:uncharacterized protein GSPATT00024252001 [Paramecium tetraurelia]CAK91524.1 unnamed protein product [Paramecium tetraurelia]|eukprot:XP_001458921.1 hypothetical protein (macronuclear) [Paramecium tetraurelia strain d4-2]
MEPKNIILYIQYQREAEEDVKINQQNASNSNEESVTNSICISHRIDIKKEFNQGAQYPITKMENTGGPNIIEGISIRNNAAVFKTVTAILILLKQHTNPPLYTFLSQRSPVYIKSINLNDSYQLFIKHELRAAFVLLLNLQQELNYVIQIMMKEQYKQNIKKMTVFRVPAQYLIANILNNPIEILFQQMQRQFYLSI